MRLAVEGEVAEDLLEAGRQEDRARGDHCFHDRAPEGFVALGMREEDEHVEIVEEVLGRHGSELGHPPVRRQRRQQLAGLHGAAKDADLEVGRRRIGRAQGSGLLDPLLRCVATMAADDERSLQRLFGRMGIVGDVEGGRPVVRGKQVCRDLAPKLTADQRADRHDPPTVCPRSLESLDHVGRAIEPLMRLAMCAVVDDVVGLLAVDLADDAPQDC